MSFTIIPPCNEIKEFVSHFWTRSWSNAIYYSTAATTIELTFGIRSTANGQSEFVFSSVKGQSCCFAQHPPSGSFELFGVSLYPYTLPFLFNVSVAELENGLIDLALLLNYDAEMLNEKMSLGATVQERIQIFSAYLKKRLANIRFEDRMVVEAIKQIKLHNGSLNIRQLSIDCCLSQKQFERRFREFAGFNPKLYAKILRFENALLDIGKGSNLTKTAYQYGYFDQSHFIRDFKRFAGFSPKVYAPLLQH